MTMNPLAPYVQQQKLSERLRAFSDSIWGKLSEREVDELAAMSKQAQALEAQEAEGMTEEEIATAYCDAEPFPYAGDHDNAEHFLKWLRDQGYRLHKGAADPGTKGR